MRVKVYLPHSFDTQYDADIIVGVDYGAYILANKGIKMDFAIGDFDSTTKGELKLISEYSNSVVKLPIKKDETDSEAAIIHLNNLGYSDITLVGDVGSRLDHLLINYRLVEKYNIKYLLNSSKVFNLKKGIHQVDKNYQFLSLFTSGECVLSLSGTKYELIKASINYLDTYTSANEIIADYASIEVFSGNVTVVLSCDK